MSEATQEQAVEKHPVPKQQTQELTDLTSFNAYAVVTLSDSQQVNVQITSRHGIPADRAYQDFKEFVKLLDLCAVDSSVKFWDGKRSGLSEGTASGGNGASTKTGSVPVSGDDKPKRSYKDPVPQGELPEELVEVTVNIWAAEFDAFEVLPKPDEKASINFMKDGLQYPVGSINKWKHDTIKQYLATLTEQEINPAEAKVYRIAGTMYFKQGNEYKDKNGQAKHYKDIVLLKPAL